MSIRHLFTALVTTAVVALALPAIAAAAEPTAEQLEAAKEHFAQGKTLYDKGDKKGAVEEFKLAYKLSKNALLLYNVGLVYDEMGEKALALHYYEKFLKEAPDSDKTRANKKLAGERSGLLKKELADDEGDVAPPVKAVDKPVEKPAPPKKPSVTEFTHVTLDEAPPAKPIDLAAMVPDDSGWKLSLYYRPQGRDEFTAVPMKPRFQELVGRIPAEAVKGQSIQYYIECKDASGKLVARSGTPASPNIVFLEKGAKAHYYVDKPEAATAEAPAASEDAGGAGEGIDEEDPLSGRAKRPPREVEAEDEDSAPIVGADDGRVRDSGKTNWAKWGTTIGAAAFIGASGFFYFTASNYAQSVKDESTRTDCSPAPCPFDSYVQDLESTGKTYELMTNVSLGIGVGTALVAGYFWYKDLTKPRARGASEGDREAARSGVRLVGAAPMVGEGLVGGQAVIEF